MFGFYPFGRAAFSSLEDAVHALLVQEASQGLDEPRVGLNMGLLVRENTAGVAEDGGNNGNDASTREWVAGADFAYSTLELYVQAAENTASVSTVSVRFSTVPMSIVENTGSADPTPFLRQKWAFVPTAQGGEWVLIGTGT